MKVRDFAEEIKNAKKEAKREKKPVAEYIAEEEEKSEAKDNNEKKPFMMGGRPTSIDMSKLNQCRPGYGFHIRGVKRCVKDPQVEGGDRKGKGNNNGRFGDQSKGKGKGRQGQRPSGKQMQRMQKMRKAM